VDHILVIAVPLVTLAAVVGYVIRSRQRHGRAAVVVLYGLFLVGVVALVVFDAQVTPLGPDSAEAEVSAAPIATTVHKALAVRAVDGDVEVVTVTEGVETTSRVSASHTRLYASSDVPRAERISVCAEGQLRLNVITRCDDYLDLYMPTNAANALSDFADISVDEPVA